MNSYGKWGSVVAGLLLAGCQIPATMIATSAGAMPAARYQPPAYDVAPQVIFSLDKNRYLTFENYSKCDGDGILYFNDTLNGIRTRIQYGSPTFLGRMNLNGDPNILAFPDAPGPAAQFCGDRGCSLAINYSLDGGRTFDRFHPWTLPSGDNMHPDVPYQETRRIFVTLKGNQLYLAKGSRADVWTLERGNRPTASLGRDLVGGIKGVPQVTTPSGQDQYVCDDSIRPK